MNFTDLTLGNYYPADSVVHRLDPRVKMVSMTALMGVTFLAASPVTLLFHTAALAAVVAAARIPLRAFLRSLRLFIWLFLFTAVLHLFLTPGSPLPGFPSTGLFSVTREGLERGGLVSWRLLSVISLSAIFTQTTTPMQITRGLESLLKPAARLRFPVQDFSLMMMIAIRFIPVLTEETQKVWKAQRSRGADLRHGSLRDRIRTLMSVIIPVFTGVFRRADDLALALEARGYVPGKPRSSMTELCFRSADLVGVGLVLAWSVAVLLAPGAWK